MQLLLLMQSLIWSTIEKLVERPASGSPSYDQQQAFASRQATTNVNDDGSIVTALALVGLDDPASVLGVSCNDIPTGADNSRECESLQANMIWRVQNNV
jgi:hypothetical protein